MGRHRNTETGVVISVDDSKDGRYVSGWEPAEAPEKPEKATKRSPRKTSD